MHLKILFIIYYCGSRSMKINPTYMIQMARNELVAEWKYWQTDYEFL